MEMNQCILGEAYIDKMTRFSSSPAASAITDIFGNVVESPHPSDERPALGPRHGLLSIRVALVSVIYPVQYL
jgi:hypothetical protein